MKRLTDRSKEIPLPLKENAAFWARAHEKLARYEDSGLDPEEIYELLHSTTGPLHKKLGQWIDAEKQGRMVVLPEPTPDIDFMRIFNLIMADAEHRVIVLPCKIGARVYKVVKTWGIVPICCPCSEYKDMQKCSYLKENGNISVCTAEMQEGTDGFINGVVSLMFDFDMLPEIGKTIFLTREEAEAALKGGTNGRNL